VVKLAVPVNPVPVPLKLVALTAPVTIKPDELHNPLCVPAIDIAI
jgi:hypothetical protein